MIGAPHHLPSTSSVLESIRAGNHTLRKIDSTAGLSSAPLEKPVSQGVSIFQNSNLFSRLASHSNDSNDTDSDSDNHSDEFDPYEIEERFEASKKQALDEKFGTIDLRSIIEEYVLEQRETLNQIKEDFKDKITRDLGLNSHALDQEVTARSQDIIQERATIFSDMQLHKLKIGFETEALRVLHGFKNMCEKEIDARFKNDQDVSLEEIREVLQHSHTLQRGDVEHLIIEKIAQNIDIVLTSQREYLHGNTSIYDLKGIAAELAEVANTQINFATTRINALLPDAEPTTSVLPQADSNQIDLHSMLRRGLSTRFRNAHEEEYESPEGDQTPSIQRADESTMQAGRDALMSLFGRRAMSDDSSTISSSDVLTGDTTIPGLEGMHPSSSEGSITSSNSVYVSHAACMSITHLLNPMSEGASLGVE